MTESNEARIEAAAKAIRDLWNEPDPYGNPTARVRTPEVLARAAIAAADTVNDGSLTVAYMLGHSRGKDAADVDLQVLLGNAYNKGFRDAADTTGDGLDIDETVPEAWPRVVDQYKSHLWEKAKRPEVHDEVAGDIAILMQIGQATGPTVTSDEIAVVAMSSFLTALIGPKPSVAAANSDRAVGEGE